MTMKACIAPMDSLRYPLLASPKLDGIRATMRSGRLVTQTGLAVPNQYIREWCESELPDGLDGELLLRDTTAPFREVSSAVMSRSGDPNFVFAVFDWVMVGVPFRLRIAAIEKLPPKLHMFRVRQVRVESRELLEQLHLGYCSQGFEGTMTRDPDGLYKRGRSTQREQLLCKLKDRRDDEAIVIGVEEEMENLNEELASGRRGSSAEGKFGKGRLGKIVCRFVGEAAVWRCGSGFTAAERELYWRQPELIMTKMVTVKHQPPRAVESAPRFPVFKAIRDGY